MYASKAKRRVLYKNRIDEMQKRNVTICEYCGKEKQGISFVIGASKTPDWVMIEGTGAMCCPDCWERARLDGQIAVRKATGLEES